MSKGNSLFTFIAGAVTGAALLLLANTEKGEEVVEDIKEKGSEAFENGRAAILKRLDQLEKALAHKEKEEAAAAEEAPEAEEEEA